MYFAALISLGFLGQVRHITETYRMLGMLDGGIVNLIVCGAYYVCQAAGISSCAPIRQTLYPLPSVRHSHSGLPWLRCCVQQRPFTVFSSYHRCRRLAQHSNRGFIGMLSDKAYRDILTAPGWCSAGRTPSAYRYMAISLPMEKDFCGTVVAFAVAAFAALSLLLQTTPAAFCCEK